MGAMSMTFTGTVEIVEQDAAAHRVLMRVKSKEAGGQGYANADVTFTLADGGGTIHTNAQITGKAASMGEGVMVGVLDALITDFAGKLGPSSMRRSPVAQAGPTMRVTMRAIREGEVPPDGGTAVQDDPDRPVFHGTGPNDYVCVECGNVLATANGPGADDEEGAGPLRPVPDGQRLRDRRLRADSTSRSSDSPLTAR